MVETNGVSLHTVTADPADGTPVVVPRGFPEFWYGWRHRIPALADAGYRVLVPDRRGYNRSDKPTGIDAYTVVAEGDPLPSFARGVQLSGICRSYPPTSGSATKPFFYRSANG